MKKYHWLSLHDQQVDRDFFLNSKIQTLNSKTSMLTGCLKKEKRHQTLIQRLIKFTGKTAWHGNLTKIRVCFSILFFRLDSKLDFRHSLCEKAIVKNVETRVFRTRIFLSSDWKGKIRKFIFKKASFFLRECTGQDFCWRKREKWRIIFEQLPNGESITPQWKVSSACTIWLQILAKISKFFADFW